MIANIASDDALILPHRANPAGLNFRERQRQFFSKDEDEKVFIDYISWKGVVDVADLDDESHPLYLRGDSLARRNWRNP
jgi:hypothetical protein